MPQVFVISVRMGTTSPLVIASVANVSGLTVFTMMQVILLLFITLYQNCQANYFSNPFVLQDLFIKELKLRALLEKVKLNHESKHIDM